MLIHLPIVIVTSLHLTPVADDVPKFDIARECQSEGGSQDMLDTCANDEKQARDQLQKEWATFGPGDRRQCYQETNADGSPSYVEFLTCLEMARDVKNTSK
jgi:hypothetical protein